MDNVELADRAQTDSQAFNYTLPSALINKEEIVFLVLHNMPIHDIESCGNTAIADWVKLKRREQRRKSHRKHVELLEMLRMVIHQTHKENMDENGIPLCLNRENWKSMMVKTENPPTPTHPPRWIKEELVTPDLQYPDSTSSDTSLDPNNFVWDSDELLNRVEKIFLFKHFGHLVFLLV